MTPKVVQSTVQSSHTPASSVFILGEPDGNLVNSGSDNGKSNYWLAQIGNPNDQGFTVRVDYCARTIAGLRMKNSRNRHGCATDEFKVSASLNEEGPWETVVDSRLPGTTHEAPTLLNFTFEQPLKLKYLKFELISYWGKAGALQYFAPIPATSEHHLSVHDQTFKKGGSVAETTSDSSITTSTVEATGQRQQKFESYWVAWKVKCILNH